MSHGKGDLDDGMFEHAEVSNRQRHSSQHQSAKQFARQAARQNKKEEEREEGEKGEVRRKEERTSQGAGVQRGNGKEQEREKKEKGEKEEEEKDKEVEKNETGWTLVTRSTKQMRRTVQIFVKVDGMKTVAMEVLPEDRVQKILNTVSGSDCDVYVTCEGRILRKGDKMKSSWVRDGSTAQVTSRTRGGRKHNAKKGKEEKQAARLDDGRVRWRASK